MEEWQHPFVNVFKLCKTEQENKDVEISGKVAHRMDEIIHRKVFRISGAIPAVNYIKLPKTPKGLTLHGRFCYLQVSACSIYSPVGPTAPLQNATVLAHTMQTNVWRIRQDEATGRHAHNTYYFVTHFSNRSLAVITADQV
eukprot:GHUV01036324.1.p1 GENE.GHUV01036324.1~~GHUV01036324.1.p1  ORF type:complete len:141 (+),score=25.50 GHUV01036324.1:196-618(+)